jgi:prolyl-tRNA synthetase
LKMIDEKVAVIKKELEAKWISVKYDNRDTQKPGWKFAEYELKGVPVRIAIGPRDLEQGTVEVARRDTKEKTVYQMTDLTLKIEHLLSQIQDNIYKKALDFRDASTVNVDTWDEFMKVLDDKGGFIMAHWDGTPETEQKIKELSKATIRCIPLNNRQEGGKCILTGKPSTQRVLFARSY